MRHILKNEEPKKHQRVFVYNVNTAHEGFEFYMDLFDGNRMGVAYNDPNIVVPVKDDDEGEEMDGITSTNIPISQEFYPDYKETTTIITSV